MFQFYPARQCSDAAGLPRALPVPPTWKSTLPPFHRLLVLVHLGCRNKVPCDWAARNQRQFISRSSGGWESEIQVPAWSGSGRSLHPGFLTGWKKSKLSGVPCVRALIPFRGLHPYDRIISQRPHLIYHRIGVSLST